MFYIHPDNPNKRYPIGQAGQGMPNGDTCLTPLDEVTAAAYGMYKLVREEATLLDYQESQDNPGAVVADVWRVTETAVDMPLEQAVNRAKADVDQRQAAALNGGIDVDGTVVDVTIDARTQIAEVQSRGGEQKLVTRRGQAVILTPESCVSTIAAIDAHRSAAAERSYDLYVAVDAAADLDALRAIDIAVGWPPTVEENLT